MDQLLRVDLCSRGVFSSPIRSPNPVADYCCPGVVYSRNSPSTGPTDSIEANYTGSKKILDIAKQWLGECQQQHPKCHSSASWYPSRLLDITGSGLPDAITLVDTRETPVSGYYLTLSHRWSSTPHLVLTEGTIDELRKGFLLERLQQAFQDAVAVTRHLGVRYLWIDSLCIIQEQADL